MLKYKIEAVKKNAENIWFIDRLSKELKKLSFIFFNSYLPRLDNRKINLIDIVFNNVVSNAKSFSDLGGVWGIDGAYTFYILKKYHIEHSFLVDTDFTQKTERKGRRFGSLKMIKGNFGSMEAAKNIGHVDVVLLFDVLLHQVNPDWDKILEIY